jgi:hypothetical protein
MSSHSDDDHRSLPAHETGLLRRRLRLTDKISDHFGECAGCGYTMPLVAAYAGEWFCRPCCDEAAEAWRDACG